VKDRIQAITNRLNGNDINTMLVEITKSSRNWPHQTQKAAAEPEAKPNSPQKHTFTKVTGLKKIIMYIPTAQEPPSLRHHLR